MFVCGFLSNSADFFAIRNAAHWPFLTTKKIYKINHKTRYYKIITVNIDKEIFLHAKDAYFMLNAYTPLEIIYYLCSAIQK